MNNFHGLLLVGIHLSNIEKLSIEDGWSLDTILIFFENVSF